MGASGSPGPEAQRGVSSSSLSCPGLPLPTLVLVPVCPSLLSVTWALGGQTLVRHSSVFFQGGESTELCGGPDLFLGQASLAWGPGGHGLRRGPNKEGQAAALLPQPRGDQTGTQIRPRSSPPMRTTRMPIPTRTCSSARGRSPTQVTRDRRITRTPHPSGSGGSPGGPWSEPRGKSLRPRQAAQTRTTTTTLIT
ncbi:linker for activation of T-cells family member 2 isoform X3 [Mustela putorius furo]|uniref:Linker for activation of T-cells family member 2 isoform X3 n=1 Tax=Mustela putorius furo TaxID=9669 RepID=A0A8U0RWQ8_MUSPF|nr:linker for activation of T-cells family member 2 isoform X3 [Mustela putorius furo]